MCEAQSTLFPLEFNRSIKIESRPERLSTDGGALVLREVTLDLDSLAVEVHGHQPGVAYTGHYRVRCHHPVVLRWGRGAFRAARLRKRNAPTADGALKFALPGIRWARQRARRV